MQSDLLRGVDRVILIDNGTHDAELRHIQIAEAVLSSFFGNEPCSQRRSGVSVFELDRILLTAAGIGGRTACTRLAAPCTSTPTRAVTPATATTSARGVPKAGAVTSVACGTAGGAVSC